jgi:hypothetical protein
MSEFSNRMNAQRSILNTVNGVRWEIEPLFGLSSKAIGRWVTTNMLDPQAELVHLVRQVATELFFLGNLSQEQVTEEYAMRETTVRAINTRIADLLARADQVAGQTFKLPSQ